MEKRNPTYCFSLFHLLFVILHLWHVQLIIHAMILFELYDKSSFLLLQQIQSNCLYWPLVTYMHFPVLPTSSYQFPAFASGDAIFPCVLLVSNFPCSPPQTKVSRTCSLIAFCTVWLIEQMSLWFTCTSVSSFAEHYTSTILTELSFRN